MIIWITLAVSSIEAFLVPISHRPFSGVHPYGGHEGDHISIRKKVLCAMTTTPKKKKNKELTFRGDAKSYIDVDAPINDVEEWLRTPTNASDFILLGSTEGRKQPTTGYWECQQPRITFMGVDIQPCFIYDIRRQSTISSSSPTTTTSASSSSPDTVVVVVEVVDSRTDILNANTNRAAKLVDSFMGQAKFSGNSVFEVRRVIEDDENNENDQGCRLEISFHLTLNIPIPRFLPLPPGINALGSTLVKRTGNARIEKLLSDLVKSYFEWAKEKTHQDKT